MLSTFDLGHYLTYPFKDSAARKNLLVGSLVMFAGFIIPVVPYLAIYGYLALIMQQVLAGEKASMPAWENWGNLISSGLRFYGVRLIFSLPALLMLFCLMGLYFVGLFAFIAQDEPAWNLLIILVLAFLCGMIVLIPVGFTLSLLAYPAGVHTVAKQNFSAGFSFGEWWPILRKNLGGFVLAIVIGYLVSFASTLVIQVLYLTIILVCLMPIVMPVLMFYMLLVMEPVAAQAYREGREKLATLETAHA